jgi:hypothetical protein
MNARRLGALIASSLLIGCGGLADDDMAGAEIAAQASTEICRSPQVVGALPDLREASGLAASRRTPGLLWSHNDSAAPVVHGIGFDGTRRGRVQVAGAAVEDWEGVAVGACRGGSCLYVADIGDNDGVRASITIYRVPEPLPGDSSTEAAEPLRLTYPDGPHDAESIFAAPDGTLFIVTKGEGTPIHLYRVPREASSTASARLEHVAQLTTQGARRASRITDGAASPDGRWVVLRTADALHFYRLNELTSGRSTTPLAFDLRALKEPQGEGVTWADASTLFLAGEGPRGGTLARITCQLPQ